MKNWTVEQVKAELPEVAVSIANEPREMCRTIGRKNQFCGVVVGDVYPGSHAVYEFAWQSVADALNFDRALII